MRIIRKDGNQFLVFKDEDERRRYFDDLFSTESRRHNVAIIDLHKEYTDGVRAENAYNKSTKAKIEEAERKSKLESEVKEDK